MCNFLDNVNVFLISVNSRLSQVYSHMHLGLYRIYCSRKINVIAAFDFLDSAVALS